MRRRQSPLFTPQQCCGARQLALPRTERWLAPPHSETGATRRYEEYFDADVHAAMAELLAEARRLRAAV